MKDGDKITVVHSPEKYDTKYLIRTYLIKGKDIEESVDTEAISYVKCFDGRFYISGLSIPMPFDGEIQDVKIGENQTIIARGKVIR